MFDVRLRPWQRWDAAYDHNMAIPILPILKAIGPLIAASSGIVTSLGERQGQTRNGPVDERIKKLEEDVLRMGEVVAGSVKQLQAMAEELRVQSEFNATKDSRLRWALICSIAALCMSAAAMVVVLMA